MKQFVYERMVWESRANGQNSFRNNGNATTSNHFWGKVINKKAYNKLSDGERYE